MSSSSADASTHLIRAAFCSEANFTHWADPRGVELEVARILHPAPPNEHFDRIGGVFHAGNRFYLQVVEGPLEAVDWFLQHSESDDRHRNFKALHAQRIESRSFRPGHMRFIGTQKEMHEIQQHVGESVFDPYRYDAGMIDAFVTLAARTV
jgi:hypothetical protein